MWRAFGSKAIPCLLAILAASAVHPQPSPSPQLVFWITPWGESFDPDRFPEYAVPGVVVAYDAECGLCTPTLRQWFEKSLSLIQRFRSRGREVFINFFCEKYVPSWSWRGYLREVVLPGEIVRGIASAIGDGRGAYLGFSELTSCVNSPECRDRLVELYDTLRAAFPGAKLYYYGSGGDSVEALRDLYMRARLDLVGLDFWEYSWTPQGITVKDHLVAKLKALALSVGWNATIVGEVGFRVDDAEAYVEPWNWSRKRVLDEGADARYYYQVLTDLLYGKNARPAYIGVWSWNDGVFAVKEEEDSLEAIASALSRKIPDSRAPQTPVALLLVAATLVFLLLVLRLKKHQART